MGDAGDEVLQVVRAFDSESSDPTKIRQLLMDFHCRLRALFCDGLCLETGLTKEMLATLRSGPKLVKVKGVAKEIGGANYVTEECVSVCLGRMAAWVRLGEQISAQEFPGFELLQALSPFNLEPHARSVRLDKTFIKTSIFRLAQVLKIDPEIAYSEFFEILPLAVQRWRQSPDNFEAWKAALLQHRIHAARPGFGKVLKKLVIRVGAWGLSTSGVEQSFARQRRTTQGLHRADMSEDHVNIDAVIMSKTTSDICPFSTDDDKDRFLHLARRAWSKLYGNARPPLKFRRRDLGRANPKKAGKRRCKSEASWIQSRRAEVKSGTDSAKVVKRTSGDAFWSEKHEKEADFQKKKLRANEIAAFGSNQLLPDEIEDGMAEEKEASDLREARRHLDREKDQAKHSLQRVPHAPSEALLRGKTVFVDSSCSERAEVLAKLSTAGLARITSVRTEADLFVVPSVASPGVLNQWALALGGHMACTPQYIISGMSSGVALSFKPALASVRKFCMTEHFVEQDGPIAAVIALKVTARNSKWKPLTEDQILEQHSRAKQQVRSQFLLFYTSHDEASGRFSAIKNKFRADTALLSFLQKPDWSATASCMNVCGT